MKGLHFFLNEDSVNRLYFFNLNTINQTVQTKFEITDLNLNISLPNFHKSVPVPNGDIYLIGGRLIDGEKSNDIYRFNYAKG